MVNIFDDKNAGDDNDDDVDDDDDDDEDDDESRMQDETRIPTANVILKPRHAICYAGHHHHHHLHQWHNHSHGQHHHHGHHALCYELQYVRPLYPDQSL